SPLLRPNTETANGLLVLQAVALLEHIHAAAGIHQLLLARKERVALGTYFDFDVLLGRPGLNHVAAGAGDGGLLVVGMYILLHLQFHLSTDGMFQINRKIL